MNSILLLSWTVLPAFYLVVCALASAALSYPLHFLLPAALDYQTLVFKLAQFLMMLGLFPIGRWLGMGKSDMGLAEPKAQFLRRWALGFGLGALMMGLHIIAIVLLDARIPASDKLYAARIAILSLKGFGVGLSVSAIEEPLFRGFLLGVLLRQTKPVYAVLISAMYFAVLHFLKTDLRPDYAGIAWGTGFALVYDAFYHLPQLFIDSFLALLTAGIFLGCVRLLAPGSGLGLCMGLHAGWVFAIKTGNSLSHYNAFSPWINLVSHFDGIIGYLSAAWTCVLIIVLTIYLYNKEKGIP